MPVHVCLVGTVSAMSAASVVLAHQGGWDELLLVAVPIALFALLLVVANRRATRAQLERDASAAHDGEATPDELPPPASS